MPDRVAVVRTRIAYHDAINGEKIDFGLPVSGDSVSFDNIRVWEATPAKGLGQEPRRNAP